MASAKRKAQNITCLNNLKQWGLACHIYADDNDDYVPEEGDTSQSISAATGAVNADAWYNTVPVSMKQQSLYQLYLTGAQPVPSSKSIFSCPRLSAAGAAALLNSPQCELRLFHDGGK